MTWFRLICSLPKLSGLAWRCAKWGGRRLEDIPGAEEELCRILEYIYLPPDIYHSLAEIDRLMAGVASQERRNLRRLIRRRFGIV